MFSIYIYIPSVGPEKLAPVLLKSSYFCSKAIFQFSQASGIKSYTTSYYTFIAKEITMPKFTDDKKILVNM